MKIYKRTVPSQKWQELHHGSWGKDFEETQKQSSVFVVKAVAFFWEGLVGYLWLVALKFHLLRFKGIDFDSEALEPPQSDGLPV